MITRLREVLAINFASNTSFNEGNVVEIQGDMTIGLPAAAASLDVVGTVARCRPAKFEGGTPYDVTVETRFRQRRDDRVAGGTGCAVGPFVLDANQAVIPYNATNHSPAAIRGLVIQSAASAGASVVTLEY